LIDHSPRRRRAVAHVGRALLGLLSSLVVAAAALAAEPVNWPSPHWNPVPLPDDLLLPMPCGGAMAFRAVAVGPAPRALPDGAVVEGPLPLGPNGQGAYLLGKYELTRLQAAALRAFAQDTDCPTALDLAQVGPDQALRAAAAEQRLPESRIAWYEARGLAADYGAWLRLNAGAYPDCRAGGGLCVPRLAGEPAVARLPTEPEWEYAARGGQAVAAGAFANPLPPPLAAAFGRYAWTMDNTRGDPEPIGTRQAGPLGLHDIFGNVSEIQHHSEPGEQGEVFIARGGGYQSQPGQADSRYRDRFRVYDAQGRGRLSETGLRLLIGAPVQDATQPSGGERQAPPIPDAELAYLQVQTSVPATVRLDGAKLGRAGPEQPLARTDRLPGTRLLLVEADGYRSHSQAVALAAGAWTRLQITLEPTAQQQEAELRSTQWAEIRGQLSALGHAPGEPSLWQQLTGGVPETTRAALRAFQQQQGLEADGHATDRTRAALAAAITAAAQAQAAARIAAEEREQRERAEAARRAEEAAQRDAEAARQAEAEAERRAQAAAQAEAAAQAKRQAEQAAAARAPFSVFRDRLPDGSEGPEMVRLPGGSFLMGSPESEAERYDNERQHEVRIKPFAIGRTAVTFDEYDAFAAATGRDRPDDRGWGRGRRPVINVSWEDATNYAAWLAEQTGKPYRLPTEAEWEYAARAGTQTPFWTGDCIHTDQANYDGNYDYDGCGAKTGVYRGKTLPVASLARSPWGLYDMLGNVWEWTCSDYDGAYGGAEQRCSSNTHAGSRALRGGSWNFNPHWARAALRYRLMPALRVGDLGFRLALDSL
jgi:formylglycine-generating enzyme required for sulfatase activity